MCARVKFFFQIAIVPLWNLFWKLLWNSPARLALRMTAREIGSSMFISHRTVERHIANMYEKLSVHNRQALLRSVYRGNLAAVSIAEAMAD